jgi:single-stranded-DNA-specific exonuclease
MQSEKIKTKAVKKKTLFEKIQGIKYLWRLQKPNDKAINKISLNHNISKPIAHVLFSRGLIEKKDINAFLFSYLEQDIPDSKLLKDSEKAVARIVKAIDKKEKILIFGDYDVDGVTSSSLVLLALIPLGANINYFLPHRIQDGYGLSSKVVKKAAQSNYKLIITVDNGITACQAAQTAYDMGIDLVITDHHRPQDKLPKAFAIVNPNQEDCSYPFKSLAGVGVIFKIINMIYEQKKLVLPDKIYELLMLGTVADVVPLVEENRYWVRNGLSKSNQERSNAISVLAQNGKITKEKLSSLDIGFLIAPQINALGRLDNSREAVTFLISSDYDEVERIGQILKNKNEERKRVELGIYEQVECAIFNKTINLEKENIIMAANGEWPSGVIGLVAGKLMYNYGKPAFLFHHDKKSGILRGSCRSIPEFDIFNALQKCKDLLLNFGGHSFAAGLKVLQSNVGPLKQKLEKLVASQVATEDLIPKIKVDAILELPETNNKLLSDMEQLEPFGNKNYQPSFIIKNVTLVNPPKLLKDKHVKCMVFADGIIKPIIFFNRPDLYKIFISIGDDSFHIAGYVTKNEWMGTTKIELQGLDIALD